MATKYVVKYQETFKSTPAVMLTTDVESEADKYIAEHGPALTGKLTKESVE